MSLPYLKDKLLQNEKRHDWAFAAAKRLVKSGMKFVMKISRYFRASLPEERGTQKFHQKFHGSFHGDFHARWQDKISRKHFCKHRNNELSAAFFCASFFAFSRCPPHPSPGIFFLPKPPLSGIVDLLFLVAERQAPGAGCWGGVWGGSPHKKKGKSAKRSCRKLFL